MPKQFKQITLDPKKCRVQIDEFGALLKSKAALSEKDDLQPFFKNRPQVSAFIGSYMRDIGPATDYAFEYPFYGDFAADLVVGDKSGRRFCVIEFEDGRTFSRDQSRRLPRALPRLAARCARPSCSSRSPRRRSPRQGCSTPRNIFAEMRRFMVDGQDMNDSRAAIYTRMEGE